MNENDTVKDLINQCSNTKRLVDEVNRAYLGITTDEIIRLAMGKNEENHHGKDEQKTTAR